MKIRNGFVSNSSSSSFLIGSEIDDPLKITISLEVDLKEFEYKVFYTLEEFKEYVVWDYGSLDGFLKYSSDTWEKAKTLFEEHKVVRIIRFDSYGSGALSTILEERGIKQYLPDNIILAGDI